MSVKLNSTPLLPTLVMGSWKEFWVIRLLINIFGYATLIVPVALLVYYVKRSHYLDKSKSGWFVRFLRVFIEGREQDGNEITDKKSNIYDCPLFVQAKLLVFYSSGIIASYALWGLLQERLMTFPYGKTKSNVGEYFKISQFLVFMNRVTAFVFGLCGVVFLHQRKDTAPLHKYSYASLSNILSSWFQYEALKYVSFPTQVIAKVSKIIPVMLMGKVVSGKTFETYEYLTAVMISLGVGLFLLTTPDVVKHHDGSTTFSGIILLLGYIACDSYTSNWQGKLYQQYHMSSLQMMACVNAFACIFTATSLLESGALSEAIAFAFRNHLFALHVLVLSLCGACGQVFIYRTIAVFGPVTFVIIMTIRQGLSIFLSCIVYQHPIKAAGILGVVITLIAILLKVYAAQRLKTIRASRADRTSNV